MDTVYYNTGHLIKAYEFNVIHWYEGGHTIGNTIKDVFGNSLRTSDAALTSLSKKFSS